MARIGKILIALLLLVGASVDARAAERQHGILEVQIKDHRDAIGDFDKLIVTIDKIAVSPKPGLKIWQTAERRRHRPVDLTQHRQENRPSLPCP
jgi:hypothetical protein